jgi:protein gp37
LAWNAGAREFELNHGHRQRVFCASLADVFDNQVDPIWRTDLYALIKMCGELDWLLLTKRPQNIRKMLPDDWGDGYRNVWLGITAEDQKRFDLRWPHLDLVPSVVKFISYEPAIGPLRLPSAGPHPNWLISGGESGGGARAMNPNWVRAIIEDCHRSGVAVFHKQWGSYKNNPLVVEHGLSAKLAASYDEYGKGGCLIDGVPMRQFPCQETVLSGGLTNSNVRATGGTNESAGQPFCGPTSARQ